MQNKFTKLLQIISDNQWHDINTITDELQMPKEKLQQKIKFLEETNLIQHNHKTSQIKLNQNWKALFIKQKEPTQETNAPKPEDTAIGTIIIPPQQTITIQNTQITNLMDTSIELEIRVDKKIREIAISKVKQNQQTTYPETTNQATQQTRNKP